MLIPRIAIILLTICRTSVVVGALSSRKINGAWDRIDINRRTTKSQTLQYGKLNGQGHPYEMYASHRLEETGWQAWGTSDEEFNGASDVYFEDNRYPVASPTMHPTSGTPTLRPTTGTPTTLAPTVISYNPTLYKPLRIHMDSRNLLPKLQSNPNRYSYLVNYIINTAAPKAAQFWSNHLSTIPVESPIVITSEDCPLAFLDDDTDDYHRFDNTDLVLYLLVDEGPCLREESPPIAFSNDCASDQFDRPIAGTLLICGENFIELSSNNGEGRSHRQKLDEVLQHELAHILGMSGSTMPYWRDASNGGKPYTDRPLVETEVTCINGETESIIMPSTNTVREGTSKTGVRYFEVVTPTVRNVLANQFDCEDVTGARLDNNEYYNCIGSHWSPVSVIHCIVKQVSSIIDFFSSLACLWN